MDNEIYLNEVLAKHLFHSFDWGKRRNKIITLQFPYSQNKQEIMTLLRFLLIEYYGELPNDCIYYHSDSITHIDKLGLASPIFYPEEKLEEFDKTGIPVLNPRVLIIDMTDIQSTSKNGDFPKFEWLSRYCSAHNRGNADNIDIFICTNNQIEPHYTIGNWNGLISGYSDISFDLSNGWRKKTIVENTTVSEV